MPGQCSHLAGSPPGATSSMRDNGVLQTAHGRAATIAPARRAWLSRPRARAPRGFFPECAQLLQADLGRRSAQYPVAAPGALPHAGRADRCLSAHAGQVGIGHEPGMAATTE